MAGLIQRAVNSLYVSDTDTSRVRDNLVSAINPVLTFLTNNFAQDNPVLTLLRGVAGTSAAFTGPVSAALLSVGGQTPFIINSDGSASTPSTFSANSLVSAQGIKQFVPLGSHWRQTGQSGIQRTYEPVYRTDTGALAGAPSNRPMPFAGSIVGISALMTNTISADVTLQIFKNNIAGTSGQIIDTAGIKANQNVPPGPITFPKGQYSFAAGDYLGAGCYVGSGYSFSIIMGVTVEMGA